MGSSPQLTITLSTPQPPLPRAGTCQEDTFCRLPPFRLFCSRKFPHDNSRNWLKMLNKSSNIKNRAFFSRIHLILHLFNSKWKAKAIFVRISLLKTLILKPTNSKIWHVFVHFRRFPLLSFPYSLLLKLECTDLIKRQSPEHWVKDYELEMVVISAEETIFSKYCKTISKNPVVVTNSGNSACVRIKRW